MKKSKKEKQINYGREPSPLIYDFFVGLIRIFVNRYFKVSGQISKELLNLEKPLIVVVNHPSYLDPFIAAAALYPLRVNFLTADTFFRIPIVRSLLYRAGCIPKVQFRPDMMAMKSMLKVIKRKGVLGVFPEGTRSIHGKNMPIEENFAKFIKKMNANVISVTLNGAYLTWPRWSTSAYRRGKIFVEIKQTLKNDQIPDLSIEELDKILVDAIRFDDYAMQSEKMIEYKSRSRAKGLHNILYKCPKCNEMWTLVSNRNFLFCTSCSNKAVMDKYGFLHAENKDSKVFKTVSEWNEWQFKKLKPEVLKKDFILEAKVKMERSSGKSTFTYAGKGTIRLKHKFFEFIPDTIENLPNENTLSFPVSGIWGISSSYGVYFDLVADKYTYKFFPEDGRKILTFSHALDIIRVL